MGLVRGSVVYFFRCMGVFGWVGWTPTQGVGGERYHEAFGKDLAFWGL